MITVCHLTSVHPPFDIRIFYKECVSLSQAGYRVVLLAPAQQSTVKNTVEVIGVKMPNKRLLRFFVAPIIMFAAALKQKAAVYHFHDPELLPCGMLLRLVGKKVVFDVHENVSVSLASKHWLPKWIARPLTLFYWVYERFALLFMNKLVLAETSYLNYYPQNKAVVVHNYPIVNEAITPNFTPSTPLRLIYSGVVHPLRGIWEMLNLVHRLKEQNVEVELWLVGEFRPQNLREQVDAYLNEHQLNNSVKIVGKVDFSQVSPLLTQAHVGLSLLKPIPNYYESLPTKILEYMQHGLPVITNNFPLYQTYVVEPQTGICIGIDNIEAYLEQIKAFLNNPERLKQCSQNGIDLIKNQFNWNIEQQKLIALYGNLLNTNRNGN